MGYPFGLTDMRVAVLDASDVPGTFIAVPAGRTLEVTPTEDEATLTGYNGQVARNVTNTAADLTMEYGGVSLEVLAAITGATIVTTGSTPNVVKRLKVGSAGVNRPYLMVIGKALDGTGDVWIVLYKAQFNLPAGSFQEGEFYITNMDGGAIRNTNGYLYEFITHETAAAIANPS